MFINFTIDNFRLFRKFEISPLSQVNLIVGKNNSGKSALLEALEVYAGRGSFLLLRRLVMERDEAWNEVHQDHAPNSSDSSIRHLFCGHRIPTIGSPGLDFSSGSNRLELFAAAVQRTVNDDGTVVSRILSPEDYAAIQDEDSIEQVLVAREGDRLRRVARLEDQMRGQRPARYSPEIEPLIPFQAVPTNNMAADRIALLWDLIGLTPLANEVLDGLRLIAPCISGLQFVESSGSAVRMPLISVSNSVEPLPLKSMGDGMTRLFHIVAALVSARNGLLLIDEFENGLHWSIQEKIWETIFRLAVQLNVQVFATTHSKDCVAGFESAWLNEPNAGAFFRLQSGQQGIPIAKRYTLETLADSLDTDVDVR